MLKNYGFWFIHIAAGTSPQVLEVVILICFCPSSRPFDPTEAVIYSLIKTGTYEIFFNHRIKNVLVLEPSLMLPGCGPQEQTGFGGSRGHRRDRTLKSADIPPFPINQIFKSNWCSGKMDHIYPMTLASLAHH